ncbi:MAG: gliding motility-associated ABC transporter permease subunit GldF [Chitinophagales bacterium]
MWSIYFKEINAFFSSLIAYISITVFLVATGLFVWVFPDTAILEYGYATLDPLFLIAPWVFMFLIPAVTMRSFSEEFSTGTIEMLVTKPLSENKIIFGKYLAALTLVLFSLLPTLVYYYAVHQLGFPPGNLDSGGITGAYIGLFFLAAVFVAIGLFASTLSKNQIVAFVLAVFLCFVFYMAFDFISELDLFYGGIDSALQWMGINYHYNSISRGVIDSRDIVYFLSLIALFLYLTKISFESRKW